MSLATDVTSLFGSGNTLKQRAGGALGIAGTVIKAPEWNLSEKLSMPQAQASEIPVNWRDNDATIAEFQKQGLESPDAPAPSVNTTKPSGNTGSGPDLKNPYANPGGGFFWDAADGWKKSGGGGGGGVDTGAIDDAYKSVLAAFGQQEEAARSGAAQSSSDIESRHTLDTEKVNAELDQMLRDLGVKQKGFQQSQEDVLDQNVVDYNALEQRANVRYGGGSSLGDLMRELAAKELYKQQGLTRREGQAGNVQFETQIQDAKLFMNQKIGDLEQFKKESLGSIASNLKASLAEISSRRGQTDTAKAEAKLGLLQQARQEAASISAQDNALRGELFSAYIANVQELSGKVLTPREIASLQSEFANINFTSQGQGQTDPLAYNPSGLSGEDEDEFNQLFS